MWIGCDTIERCIFYEYGHPQAKTQPVPGKAGEVAFWIHPKQNGKSLIIGSDESSLGALYLYDLHGTQIGRSPHLNCPVGVSIRYGILLDSGEQVDVVACAIRNSNEMKIFKINPNTRQLTDITTSQGIASGFEKQTSGICLYKRPKDGQLFAFLSCKGDNTIHQIQLNDDGTGKIKGTIIRKFGEKEPKGCAKGMVVDDDVGFYYCISAKSGILKYYADPDFKRDTTIHSFGKHYVSHNCRSLAIYPKFAEISISGYLIAIQGNSLSIYKRLGNNKCIKSVTLHKAGKSHGIAGHGDYGFPKYSDSFFVVHNGSGNNYLLFNWFDCTGI